MQNLKGNCLVGQSGGPTAAINSSLCGVIEQALKSDCIQKVYGAINGLDGILEKRMVDLSEQLKTEEDFYFLQTTPAAYLGSCRHRLPSLNENTEIYEKIFEIFSEYDIRYFFYIGGNDSMDTVMKLSEYAKKISFPIQVIGVPKTIDNDLMGTDHTPGFGSAAKFIATTVSEITLDSQVYDLESVTIIEIMGRNAGWLTAASALARNEYNSSPDLIYLPEVPFSTEQFINDIKNIQKHKKNVIVAVSEGIKDDTGEYICNAPGHDMVDAFGHKQLGGTGQVLENIVRNQLGCKVRSVELNVLQRCAGHLTSKVDLDEAYKIGTEAVNSAINGQTGVMMVFKRNPGPDYSISISAEDVTKIANQEKAVPREWINSQGNDITEELVEYMKPLIMGETKLIMRDGLPVYLALNK